MIEIESIKMKGPENHGGFSYNGLSYTPDKKGIIEVPNDHEHISAAQSHGFTLEDVEETSVLVPTGVGHDPDRMPQTSPQADESEEEEDDSEEDESNEEDDEEDFSKLNINQLRARYKKKTGLRARKSLKRDDLVKALEE